MIQFLLPFQERNVVTVSVVTVTVGLREKIKRRCIFTSIIIATCIIGIDATIILHIINTINQRIENTTFLRHVLNPQLPRLNRSR